MAGVINRFGHVALPVVVPDAEYKGAEWNALFVAWLHGLNCPVVNRPRCGTVHPPAAAWRQRAAASGLPIWPVALHAAGSGDTGASSFGSPGLLVIGNQSLEPAASLLNAPAPHWPAGAHRAAVEAAAAAGYDVLAWTGNHDADGLWRIGGATPIPDLRPFGSAAVAALAALMRADSARAAIDGAATSPVACVARRAVA